MDWPVIVEAGATVALAFFGWSQLHTEGHRRKREDRAEEMRAATIAQLLRRQLLSWLGIEPHHDGGVTRWAIDARDRGTYGKEIDIAEARITELANLAAELDDAAATALRSAFADFLTGTTALNRIANETVTAPDSWRMTDEPYQWRETAQGALARCQEQLLRIVAKDGRKALAASTTRPALTDDGSG